MQVPLSLVFILHNRYNYDIKMIVKSIGGGVWHAELI